MVDDGSTDETGAIADVFAKTHTGVIVLHHKVNFRLGQALQYAFGQSKGDYVVTFDSDLSYSVDHIGRLLDALVRAARPRRGGVALHEGRPDHGHPVAARAMSKGVNKLLSRVTALPRRHRHRHGAGLRRAVHPQPRPQGHGPGDQHRDPLQGPDHAGPGRGDPGPPRLERPGASA